MANKKPPAPTGGSEALKVSQQSASPQPQDRPTVIRTEQRGKHTYELLSHTPPARVKPGRTVRKPDHAHQQAIPGLTDQLQGGPNDQRA